MRRLTFTKEQSDFLCDLGFTVLKTKATFYPPWTKDGRDHVLAAIDYDCHFGFDGKLGCDFCVYTMHGRYGCTVLTIPLKKGALSGETIFYPAPTANEIAQKLLNLSRNDETKDFVDLVLPKIRFKLLEYV